MMRCLMCCLTLTAGSVLLAACGGSGSPTIIPNPGPLPGMVWIGGEEGYPIEGGTPVLPRFAERVSSFDADRRDLWVGSAGGNLYSIRTDGTGRRGPYRVSDVSISAIAFGGGTVWAANDGSAGLPQSLIAFDALTSTHVHIRSLLTGSHWFDGIVVDGADVFVLLGNSFALAKLDAASRSLLAQVELGEDPTDPTGPRGDFYGTGEIDVDSSSIWVLDRSVGKLHEIAKTDLALLRSIDLAHHVPATSDYDHLAVGAARVYVSDSDSGATDVVVAIDKLTGASSVVVGPIDYLGGGLEVFGDTLLVQDGGPFGSVYDGRTGNHRGNVPFSLQGRPFLWVP